MQVILLERVEKLGQMGDQVSVKDGFARNYLLPRGKALRATEANIAYFDSKKAELEASNLKLKTEAEDMAKRVEGKIISMIRQASEIGHLYGSVRSSDVVEGMAREGVTITRSQVVIHAPIKNLGFHEIQIKLHPEVFAGIHINVARSEEEAELQAERFARGEDVMGGSTEQQDDFVSNKQMEVIEQVIEHTEEPAEEQAAE